MNPKTIATFIILVFAGVTLFVLVWPKIGEIRDLRRELKAREAEVQIAEQRILATKEAIEQYEGLSSPDIDLVESALPDDADLPNLYILVESLISSAGLIGERVQIVPDSAGESLNITLTLRGSYESFGAFLKEAEKSLRILDVGSIGFSSSDNGDIETFEVIIKTWLF